MTALLGLAIAFALWWGLKALGRADPAAIKRLPKMAGGVVALGIAALLLVRGQMEIALLVGGLGAWLLGWSPALPARLQGLVRPSRAVSRLRSAIIELDVDAQSGKITGCVLAGPYVGRDLDSLGAGELRAIRSACLVHDREGQRLIEAYLDRRFADWREHAEPDPDAGGRADPKRGPMTEQEAYQVLGLEPGSDADAIRSAHRALMKKLHPDQGGSTYLASRVNQAKDVLLNRHR